MPVRRFAFMAALLLPALLSIRVMAQTDAIAWQANLEAAQAEARQTGKLVLVHFWTEECAPCMALERNVFSQPEVANAVKLQFVPVKLNANANPATAMQMGVTRVPTDVVLTPDGQIINKLVSPSTPMAYVGELSQVHAQYQSQSGQAMSAALANATQPSQIPALTGGQGGMVGGTPTVNSVYAGLSMNTAAAAAAIAQQQATTPVAAQTSVNPADRYAANPPFGGPAMGPAFNPPASPAAGQSQLTQPPTANAPLIVDNRYGQGAPTTSSYATQPAAGQVVTNQFAAVQFPAAPMSPAAGAPLAQPPVAAVPTAMNQSPTQQPAVNMGAPAYPAAQNPAAANVAGANNPPDQRQLPAGAPPLGFDGYCPVSMRSEWKWVAGNPQYGAIHRGRTYWFAGPTQQQQFLANPDYYSPALSGIDPVLAIEHRQQVSGKRDHSIDYDNLFYLFSSEASLQQFMANPERYAAGVRAAMGIQRGRAVR